MVGLKVVGGSVAKAAGQSGKRKSPRKQGKSTKRKAAKKRELSATQKRALRQHETAIRKGQQWFIATAKAIRAIEVGKLWVGHASINAYLHYTFDMSGTEASRYKTAGRVLETLEKAGFKNLPDRESQCRVLGLLDPKDQAKVWKAISAAEKVTADSIHDTAVKLKLLIPPAKTEKVEEAAPSLGPVGRLVQVAQTLSGVEFDESDKDKVREQLDLIERLVAGLRAKL